jgi:hypothetical protein
MNHPLSVTHNVLPYPAASKYDEQGNKRLHTTNVFLSCLTDSSGVILLMGRDMGLIYKVKHLLETNK